LRNDESYECQKDYQRSFHLQTPKFECIHLSKSLDSEDLRLRMGG
jgi:hypothetical protein